MTEAVGTYINLLVTARAMVQAVEMQGLPVEDRVSWKIRPITVTGPDGPQAGLWGDMLIQSPAGWECGVAAVLSVTGWPNPAVGDEYDEQERRAIGTQLVPEYRHALWDHAATVARVQNAMVNAGLHIPTLTPDHELIFAADEGPVDTVSAE